MSKLMAKCIFQANGRNCDKYKLKYQLPWLRNSKRNILLLIIDGFRSTLNSSAADWRFSTGLPVDPVCYHS